MVKVIGLSDAPTMPTGFGRVSRELFDRLSDLTEVKVEEDGKSASGGPKYDLGYLSTNWFGTARNRRIVYYCGQQYGQAELPFVVDDFAGQGGKAVLWTLMDPWQTSWLSFPDTSPYASNPEAVKRVRDRLKWVMHFTIDGEGPTGATPRWVHKYIETADYPVAMSEWGRRLVQPLVKKEVRFISHAVDTSLFSPGGMEESRKALEMNFDRALIQYTLANAKPKDEDEAKRAVEKAVAKRLRLQDKFVVTCVMANRPRKYWWDVLRAFASLQGKTKRECVLIAVCGDAQGKGSEGLPLVDIARDLGLRMPGSDADPNVWFVEVTDDRTVAAFVRAADLTWLASAGEGFGLPQLEAHACGKPCIVGNYSASSELIVNRREGIEPSNWWWEGQNQVKRPIYRYKDFAERTAWAAANPSWIDEVGQAGLEQARARSWERILPLWVALFDEAGAALEARDEASRPASPASPVDGPGAREMPGPVLPTVPSAEVVSEPSLVQTPPRPALRDDAASYAASDAP